MLRFKKTEFEPYLKRLKTNSRTGNFDNNVGTFFWLCAQLGLVADTTLDTKTTSTDDAGIRFVKDLFPYESQIRGLLLWRELQRFDVEPQNREDLENIIRKILGGDKEIIGQTKLSSYGESQISKYAHGGLKIIKRRIKEPDDLFTFLVDYKEILDEYSKKS